VLHGDDGSALGAVVVLAVLYWLGAKPQYPQPRASADNTYARS